ncbi:MAG: T9SS type A sorting domain-containing protein [Flavobacteriales bacterium]|nr:T9SS type A sorting domain-containing protein [Flavobacteriales bacterium]
MRAALFTLAVLPLLAAAQSWCPPGATWTYRMQATWGEGYYELAYAGDSLVAGQPAQKITSLSAYHYYADDTTIVTEPLHYTLTVAMGDLVGWWDMNALSFDTLYDFAATPGDHWLPPNAVGLCPPYERIEVVDTGSTSISGVSLRYLDIRQAGAEDTVYSRITERLGWEWEMNIWPPCAAPPMTLLGLVCYSDDEISWTDPDWSIGCQSVASIVEKEVSALRIFPNPGTTHFTLDLPPGPHTITLYDATGRMVLHQRTTDAQPVIATNALPAGLYRITVRDERSGVLGLTWVKE